GEKLLVTLLQMGGEGLEHGVTTAVQHLDGVVVTALLGAAGALLRLLEQAFTQDRLRRFQQIAVKRQGQIAATGQQLHQWFSAGQWSREAPQGSLFFDGARYCRPNSRACRPAPRRRP